tara:strand:+ start:3120 stop:3302 length:183 start_codon:yes stop_codon:yes gene_type:complete
MKKQSSKAKLLKQLAAARGIERKRHFEAGGSLVDWRGGTRTVTKNKKKSASKQACRKRFL